MAEPIALTPNQIAERRSSGLPDLAKNTSTQQQTTAAQLPTSTVQNEQSNPVFNPQSPVPITELAPSIQQFTSTATPGQQEAFDPSKVVDFTQQRLDQVRGEGQRDRDIMAKEEEGIATLAGLQGLLTGQSADLTRELKDRGQEEKENRIQAFNNRAIQLQSELGMDQASLSAGLDAIEAQAIPMEFITGQQLSVEKRAQTARAFKVAELDMINAQVLAEQGNLALAEKQAQRAVDQKYAPYKERIAAQDAWLKTLEPVFDAAEKREAARVLQENKLMDQKIEDRKDFEKQRNDLAIKASGFKAPGDIVEGILNAETMVDAINASSQYLSAKEDPLDRLLKLADLDDKRAGTAKKNKEIEKLNKEIKDTGTQLDLSNYAEDSPEWYAAKFMNSSGASQKFSATERDDMGKILLITESMDDLTGKILNSTSGPVAGRTRKVLTLFGKDADASAINAQIQGMVPGVARGIFSEVGVLTNADIENYKKTIPDLQKTEDQNRAVSAVLLKTLQKSLETKLRSATNSGVDVSGWADDYVKVTSQINEIEDDIGITKLKIKDAVAASPDSVDFVAELVAAGATDREIWNELNK